MMENTHLIPRQILVGPYLHWNSFGNIHDHLNIGIVVVIWAPRDWHIVISHFNVFWR